MRQPRAALWRGNDVCIELRCLFNELVAIAIEDFLGKQGLHVRQGLADDLTRPERRVGCRNISWRRPKG